MRIQPASGLHLELRARAWPQECLITAAPGADVDLLIDLPSRRGGASGTAGK